MRTGFTLPRVWPAMALLLLFVAPSFGPASSQSTRAQTPPADLDRDTRLQRTVTVEETGISLEELLLQQLLQQQLLLLA